MSIKIITSTPFASPLPPPRLLQLSSYLHATSSSPVSPPLYLLLNAHKTAVLLKKTNAPPNLTTLNTAVVTSSA